MSRTDNLGHLAALVLKIRSHMNGSMPFKGTLKQTTETMVFFSPKTITADTIIQQ